jgi:NADPH:quinone reductase-like Zn-dependent oxidoreductase
LSKLVKDSLIGGGVLKAIRIHEFGGPEVLKLEDIPEPQAGKGEIRIKVIAAGINPIDWKMRQGAIKHPLPMTLGLDVAGIVDSLGEEAGTFHLSDEIFAKLSAGQGGYAEYTATSVHQAALKPRNIGFTDAAAIPTAGLAAWQALFDIAVLEKGQSVLIHGAAGGVGSYAIQFAKWKGAYAIGTASGAHLQFVKGLGADEVIDYKSQRFEDVVKDLDVVLDTVGADTFDRSWAVLKPGGTLVTTVAHILGGAEKAHGVSAKSFITQPDGGELAQIAAIIDQGRVKPMVTTVLPLEEARKAQEISESRHAMGKIVLRVAEDPR